MVLPAHAQAALKLGRRFFLSLVPFDKTNARYALVGLTELVRYFKTRIAQHGQDGHVTAGQFYFGGFI
jgi:hypothetical protein